ncbi:MAG: hypothetical protein SFY32_13445 [Bacteroidota bacterium]|nr:hypothetical protein [Bacteroidota bacterium]
MKVFEYTGIQILEKYNFSKEDAEAFLEIIKEAKSDDLATKGDIIRLEKEISNNSKEIIEIKKDIAEIKKDTRTLEVKIESTKNQLVIWMVSVMFAMTTLFTIVVKLL